MKSVQELHCLPFHLHLMDRFLYDMTSLFEFKGDYSKQYFTVVFFAEFTCIVLPFLAVTTSPGLVAVPLHMFSHSGIKAAIKA